ncbi:tetratricopeptide repeat protein [Desulfosarcina ovata]|uniref:Uncharacterized protein n=1 Tax=Desulfosarcina ovata subsp. ovata TaxID=2752305 RepID=A0A5K8ALZ9_9BACT|nr:tetratricopeptide repeat protein [Desulfosarcina ovata]BBO92860.1 hypothetical protein DSCOOX_60400 [Desulfosarcina ovata subsp. ovata]
MMITRSTIVSLVLLLCLSFGALASDGPDRTARKYYKKGTDAFEKSDFDGARTNLQKAIENYPSYADAYFKLGNVALKEKKLQEAVSDFAKATSIDPAHADAQLALGRIYLAARKPEAALQRVDTILKRQPDNLDAILVKGSALLLEKRTGDAIRLLDPLYAKGQRDVNLIVLLSSAYFKKADPDNGKKILESGIAKHPQSTLLHLQLANFLLRRGDLKNAQATMETVVKIDPDNAAHAIALARLYWQTQDKEKAEHLLARSLEQNPADAPGRIAIANFYLEEKQIDPARDILLAGIAAGDPGVALKLALGELYIKTGNAQAAVDLLKSDLEQNQTAGETERNQLRNALAKIYIAARDPATAKTYVEAVLANDPHNLQALASRGMALKATGNPQAAIVDFNQVLARQPDFLGGYIQLADAYVMRRQLQAARETLDKGLHLAPHNRELLMAAYRVNLKDKDYKQAETHLRTLVEESPDAVDAQAELGDFYLALNDESSARREYSEIVLKAPRSPIGYIKLARLYLRQGKKASAVAQLRKGYQQGGKNPLLAAELITALLTAEQYDDAMALCDARLNEKPDEALAHDLKGKVMTRMKKFKAAQKAFEKAVALEPKWPQAGNDLAALFILQDKRKEAIAQFRKALADNPKNPVAYLTLGKLYEDKREYEKAIEIYKKGVGQVPGFWTAANRLAFLIADRTTSMETLDEAQKIASAAFRMKPGEGMIVDTLGWIHYKKGETEQALALYEKLIAAAPEDPLINYHMGAVLEKDGDIESARKRLKTATRGDTAFMGRERAEAMLKKLGSKS